MNIRDSLVPFLQEIFGAWQFFAVSDDALDSQLLLVVEGKIVETGIEVVQIVESTDLEHPTA